MNYENCSNVNTFTKKIEVSKEHKPFLDNYNYKCRPNTKTKYSKIIKEKLAYNYKRYSSKKILNNKEMNVNSNFGNTNISSLKKNHSEKKIQIKLKANNNCSKKIKNKINIEDNLKINLKYNIKNSIFINLSNSNFKKNNNKFANKIGVSCEKSNDNDFKDKNLISSNSKRSLLKNTKKINKSFANINSIKNISKNKNIRNQSNPFKEQKIIPSKLKIAQNKKNINNDKTNENIFISECNNNNNILNLNATCSVKEAFLKNKNKILETEKTNSKNHKIKRKSRNIQDPNNAFKSIGSIDATTLDANITNTNTNSNTYIYITYNNVNKCLKPFQSTINLNSSESNDSKYNKKIEMNSTYKTNKVLCKDFTSPCYIYSKKNKIGVSEKNKKSGMKCKVTELIDNNVFKSLKNNSKNEKNKTAKMKINKVNGKNKEAISCRAIKCANKTKK